MSRLEAIVPGKPWALKRSRSVGLLKDGTYVKGAKTCPHCRGRVAIESRHYDPADQKREKQRVARYLLDAAKVQGFKGGSGPWAMHIVSVCRRPETRPPIVPREAWATGARVAKPTRPDADNYAKMAADALPKSIMDDDARIVALTVTKWYAAKGEEPHTTIIIEPAEWSG